MSQTLPQRKLPVGFAFDADDVTHRIAAKLWESYFKVSSFPRLQIGFGQECSLGSHNKLIFVKHSDNCFDKMSCALRPVDGIAAND